MCWTTARATPSARPWRARSRPAACCCSTSATGAERPRASRCRAIGCSRWRSAPLERRRRLLVGEGGDAGLEVLGAAGIRDGLRLQLHLRLEALPRGLVEQTLGGAEGLRRPLRQLARERVDGTLELGVRHPARDEAPVQRR